MTAQLQSLPDRHTDFLFAVEWDGETWVWVLLALACAAVIAVLVHRRRRRK